MSNNDGGPAFPQPMRDADGNWIGDFGLGGMSLRDHFAAQAPLPPKWWRDGYPDAWDTSNDLKRAAQHESQWRYAYADAMLAERAKATP